MAEDIRQFQAGREAAMSGQKRDGRRSADWLEGYNQIRAAKEAWGRSAYDAA